jgi:uncharacterized protein YjbJ (UPF0337 family)
MTSDNTADEARKGLADSTAGKAKEFAGALTGKDELTEEGQLQQADARARREANSEQAIADAQSRQAAQQLQQEQERAAAEQRAGAVESTIKQQVIEHDAETERSMAEARAHQQERAAQGQAGAEAVRNVRETTADAQVTRSQARATENTAAQQHDQLLNVAEAEERRAAELRAQAKTSEGERS